MPYTSWVKHTPERKIKFEFSSWFLNINKGSESREKRRGLTVNIFYSWWIVKRETPAHLQCWIKLLLIRVCERECVYSSVFVCCRWKKIIGESKNAVSLKESTQDELFDGWRLTKADTSLWNAKVVVIAASPSIYIALKYKYIRSIQKSVRKWLVLSLSHFLSMLFIPLSQPISSRKSREK